MSRAGKSRRWFKQHTSDPYVKKAQREGYRSRAAYKLEDIDKRHRILKPGSAVIELGAAPGGWTQLLAHRLGADGLIVACDLLEMEPVAKTRFIQGDFTDQQIQEQISALLDNQPADLVISDMAPNLTGIKDRDRALSEELLWEVFEFASANLVQGGAVLAKGFTGPEMDQLRAQLREIYQKVVYCKPSASRDKSAEIYLLALGYDI